MIEKKSEYKKMQDARDAKILERMEQLEKEGYMKMQAYKVLCSEFGLFSTAGIYKSLQRAKQARGDEN